ncbi:putative oxygenase MesX, partial [Enterobacter hormaechei]
IISVDMNIGGDFTFPAIEILQTTIVDKKNHERIEGIVGNNFSSYVRDYDFSVLLLEHNKDRARFSLPENFGELHGNIFKSF